MMTHACPLNRHFDDGCDSCPEVEFCNVAQGGDDPQAVAETTHGATHDAKPSTAFEPSDIILVAGAYQGQPRKEWFITDHGPDGEVRLTYTPQTDDGEGHRIFCLPRAAFWECVAQLAGKCPECGSPNTVVAETGARFCRLCSHLWSGYERAGDRT